jgi:predicted regulator of Ras-like GTPase activity (Roadblock/LC7/MglB family)
MRKEDKYVIKLDISIAITQILIKLLKNSPGLQQVMVTDSTGLTIASISKSSNNLELEGIGALTTALFLGMNYQGEELRLGELGFVFSEFSGGKLILQSVTRDYVLVGILSQKASVQKIKSTIQRYMSPIVDQIKLLRTSQDVDEKIEKNLFADALLELE